MSDTVSLVQIYQGGLARIPEKNWLDSMVVGSPGPLLRPDPFARPTAIEIRRGLGGNIGGVRLVNCLNVGQTEFPRMTLEAMKELGGGPYLLKLAISYLTNYRVNVIQNQPYINLPNFHHTRRQGNGYMQGTVQGLGVRVDTV